MSPIGAMQATRATPVIALTFRVALARGDLSGSHYPVDGVMSEELVPLTTTATLASSCVVGVDRSLYSSQVVLRAIHYLAPKVVGAVTSSDAERWSVSLSAGTPEVVAESELKSRFFVALSDFVLRERLERETLPVRELIVRQAFERSNLQWPELDAALPGEDPLSLGQPDIETGRRHDNR